MKNMKTIISSINKKKLYPIDKSVKKCRCKPGECPLDGECRAEAIVYKAEISLVNNNSRPKVDKLYFGISEPPFTERLRGHRKSFNNRKYMDDTELSKYIWSLKNKNQDFTIKW